MEKHPYRSRSKAYQSPRLSASVWSLAVLAVLAPLVPVQLLLAAQHVGAVPSVPRSVPLLWRPCRCWQLGTWGSVEPLRRRSGVQPPPGETDMSMGTMIALRLRELVNYLFKVMYLHPGKLSLRLIPPKNSQRTWHFLILKFNTSYPHPPNPIQNKTSPLSNQSRFLRSHPNSSISKYTSFYNIKKKLLVGKLKVGVISSYMFQVFSKKNHPPPKKKKHKQTHTKHFATEQLPPPSP